MSVSIVCKKSSKGKLFYALTINDIYVNFDVLTIARVSNIHPNDIYSLDEDDIIELS